MLSPEERAGEPSVHPRTEEVAGPGGVLAELLGAAAVRARGSGPDAPRRERCRAPSSTANAMCWWPARVEVHPVGVHHLRDRLVAHPPHVDEGRAVLLADLARKLVEDGHPAPHRGVDPAAAGVEDREHHDAGTAGGKAADRRVVGSGQLVEVDPRAQHVVAAGVDADQVGLEGQGRLELLVEDRVQLATADRQVGVAEVVVAGGEHLGHPVGPAPQAVGAGGVGITDPFGEGVAEGDVPVESSALEAGPWAPF